MSRLRRALQVRWVVTAAFVVAIVALTVGPVQAIVEHRPQPSDALGGYGPDPAGGSGGPGGSGAGCDVRNPAERNRVGGVWTTAGTDRRRTLPAPRRLTYAQATAATGTPAGAVHLVGGTVLRHRERGVQAVLTAGQRRQLSGLTGAGCRSLRDVWTGLDDALPVGTVASTGDLPDRPAPGPVDLDTVVTDEIVPALNSPRGLRAAFADGAGHAGLYAVSPSGLTATVRGRAYAVLAHAVGRGTRDVRLSPGYDGSRSGLSVRAFLRADGRSTLLVWNPGPARTVVVDVPMRGPAHGYVARWTVRVPGHALTTVALPARHRQAGQQHGDLPARTGGTETLHRGKRGERRVR